MRIVRAAEQGDVVHRSLAACRERHAVMKLDESSFGATARRADKRALAAIPLPDGSTDARRNGARASARIALGDSIRRRHMVDRRPRRVSPCRHPRLCDRRLRRGCPSCVGRRNPPRLSSLGGAGRPRGTGGRAFRSLQLVEQYRQRAIQDGRRIAIRNRVAQQILGAPQLGVGPGRHRHLDLVTGRRERANHGRMMRRRRRAGLEDTGIGGRQQRCRHERPVVLTRAGAAVRRGRQVLRGSRAVG